MAIVAARNYSFTYPGEGAEAVKDVSFDVGKGEVILIAGDSGSGKSTLLKSLNGLIPNIVEGRMSGKRYVGGRDFESLEIYDISRVVGSVFQNPRSQFFTLNSTSEMAFAMENYGYERSAMLGRVAEIKKMLPIDPIMDRETFSLSSGERQLLALSSSMVLDPDILLFDEPSANLDYSNSMKLKAVIEKLKSFGKTVLVADHRFYYLNGIIDRVFLVRDHTLTVFGSEAEFKLSDYNTRSFDLFALDIPFRKEQAEKEAVARIDSVCMANILRDVSLTLNKKEIAAVVGANGVGKTTLARIIVGSLKPDSGSVQIGEMPFYVMQDADYQLFGTSVENEVGIGNGDLDEETKKAVLEELDIWKYRDTHPFDLSGGEKQRLQIATATLSAAGLLIFDEPTSGLDIKSMDRVVGEITRLAESRAVMIISHDYEFIRKVSDRIIYMKKGRIADDFVLNSATINRLNDIFRDMEIESE